MTSIFGMFWDWDCFPGLFLLTFNLLHFPHIRLIYDIIKIQIFSANIYYFSNWQPATVTKKKGNGPKRTLLKYYYKNQFDSFNLHLSPQRTFSPLLLVVFLSTSFLSAQRTLANFQDFWLQLYEYSKYWILLLVFLWLKDFGINLLLCILLLNIFSASRAPYYQKLKVPTLSFRFLEAPGKFVVAIKTSLTTRLGHGGINFFISPCQSWPKFFYYPLLGLLNAISSTWRRH